MDATVSITADEAYGGKEDPGGTLECGAYGFGRVHVSMPGEARCNGDEISGAEERCRHCSEPLSKDPDSEGRRVTLESGQAFCGANPDADAHEPQYIAGSFANSASISVSDDDSVTVTISVGDPRGAFAMTVSRHDDGQLYLSVPSPRDPLPHMTLTYVNRGFCRIG